MKGDDLLLAHLAILDDPEEREEPPSAEERLEAALGPELARTVLALLPRG